MVIFPELWSQRMWKWTGNVHQQILIEKGEETVRPCTDYMFVQIADGLNDPGAIQVIAQDVTRTPPPSSNKAAHSGFETQRRRHHKSETGVSVAPKMDMCPTKVLQKAQDVKPTPRGRIQLQSRSRSHSVNQLSLESLSVNGPFDRIWGTVTRCALKTLTRFPSIFYSDPWIPVSSWLHHIFACG